VSWLLAGLGFAALIILHELGHFAAAKAVGMRVERFALFFPPLLGRVRRGETEYAIGSIPLGGYVKISGMTPHEDLPPEVAPRAYFRQPVWKRVVVIAAGPAVNLVLAFMILWILFWSRGLDVLDLTVRQVQPRTPAAEVLQPGDRILSVDGRPGFAANLSEAEVRRRANALRAAVASHRCAGTPADGCLATDAARVAIERDGERRVIAVTPRYDATERRTLLGFQYGTRGVPIGPAEAAQVSVTGMWNVTRLTVDNIVRLFYDDEARKQVSGVVGSYEATRQSFELDTVQAVRILALISLSLAIINLFPFLPLDGGHIFWAVAEKVRGKPIPFSVLERVSVVGFMLVAFLFVIGLTNDIGRITSGEGFGVR